MLIFLNDTLEETRKIRDILDFFYLASTMKVNNEKSFILIFGLNYQERKDIGGLFYFTDHPIEDGMKYLGFRLKPNLYAIKD